MTLCANAIHVRVLTIANALAVLKVAVMVDSAPLKESIVLSAVQVLAVQVALNKF